MPNYLYSIDGQKRAYLDMRDADGASVIVEEVCGFDWMNKEERWAVCDSWNDYYENIVQTLVSEFDRTEADVRHVLGIPKV